MADRGCACQHRTLGSTAGSVGHEIAMTVKTVELARIEAVIHVPPETARPRCGTLAACSSRDQGTTATTAASRVLTRFASHSSSRSRTPLAHLVVTSARDPHRQPTVHVPGAPLASPPVSQAFLVEAPADITGLKVRLVAVFPSSVSRCTLKTDRSRSRA